MITVGNHSNWRHASCSVVVTARMASLATFPSALAGQAKWGHGAGSTYHGHSLDDGNRIVDNSIGDGGEAL